MFRTDFVFENVTFSDKPLLNMVGHGGAKTDAYDCEKVKSFKRLGYSVECMTAYDDVLLVAVKDQLLKYTLQNVFDTNKNKQKYRLQGPTSNNVFRKQVTEMQAIPDNHFKLLLSVQDNMIHVYDLEKFSIKTTITGSKGFQEYAVSIQDEKDSQGIFGRNLKICVAIGRKLVIYEWDGMSSFVPIISDLSLYEPVTKLLWSTSYLFVGLKDEYLILNPNDGTYKQLFNYGKSLKQPLVLSIGDKRVLLQHDSTSMMVRNDGKPYDSDNITWTGVPSHIVCEMPYIIAVLPRYIEVRTLKPSVSIQQIEIRHVTHICSGKGVVFVHCKDGLYMLTLRPLTYRIKHMVESRNYPIAIQLQKQQLDKTTEERLSLVNAIQMKEAVHLFCVLRFKDSMSVFATLPTDPSHVIGLLPDLLPSKLSNSIEYPEKIPTLSGKDLNKALSELVDYLLKKKAELSGVKEEDMKPFLSIMETKGSNTLKSKEQVMSVIDTTLVKCYIQIDKPRVKETLLYPDNCVHFKEAEKALKNASCYPELILLYKQHKHYDKALEVLKKRAGKQKSPLCGLQPTIELLQEIGKEYIDLIFDYAEWVLAEDPYEGLKIFKDDLPTVKDLPRVQVSQFIEKVCPLVLVDYLEHIIYEWGDETEEIHEKLAEVLRLRVMKELETQKLMQGKDISLRACAEDEVLKQLRKKFIKFLKTSSIYNPEHVCYHLPADSLYEEKAIVFGLMKKYEEALGIYVYVLEDPREVDEFCYTMYNKKGASDIYLTLLKVYLNPPGPLKLGLNDFQREPKPRVRQALYMLESHATKIDMLKAITILPDDIKVKKARAVLEIALNDCVTRRYRSDIVRNMQYQNYIQTVTQQQEECCKEILTITDSEECNVCGRKIGCKSVFARNCKGDLAHHKCYSKTERSSVLF